jgi:hypothetical protein
MSGSGLSTGAATLPFIVPQTQPLAALAFARRRTAATVEARAGHRRHGRARIAAQPLLVNKDGRRNVFELIGVRLAETRGSGRQGLPAVMWLVTTQGVLSE